MSQSIFGHLKIPNDGIHVSNSAIASLFIALMQAKIKSLNPKQALNRP